MSAHQQQFRRGTSAQCDSITPTEGEVIVDTSNDRLRIGDGARAGGFPVPNAFDMQQMPFNFAVAGGSSNALTLTLTPAPSGYAQPMTIMFRASSTNTGAATIDVNGLGARNLYKISGGTVTALTAGDIISGGLYIAVYDGTQFQVYGLQSTGLVSVSQGNLNTSTGSISVSAGAADTISTDTVLPGGQYGFTPTSSYTRNSGGGIFGLEFGRTSAASGVSLTEALRVTITITNQVTSGGLSNTAAWQQRYITSSPPFDMGDGEAGGFIYALLDGDGKVVSHYAADVPPWAYNGPTDIRCTHKCPVTGKKYRRVPKKLTPEQIMDGAKIEYVTEEITQKIKNADMGLIPHPFGAVPSGHSVVLVDPMSDKVRRLIELQNAGDTAVSEIITKGYLQIDSEKVSRKCPKGVQVCAAKYRSVKNG